MSLTHGTEDIEYAGYRLEVHPYGLGWRVFIFAPNSSDPLTQTPWSHDPEERADIIVKAKALVDDDIAKKSGE
jgi:hypothetical protein